MAKTYRVGVIGRTGRGDYGHQVDTCWLEIPNVEVVAVADDNKDGLSAAAQRLKVKQTFADYRELLDKAKPDIVAVASRWVDQHRDIAVAAAERGIHVYMEKPLSRSPAEADEIVDACTRTHVKLAVAFPTRYSPKFETVKQLISSGKIGKVLEYRGRGKEDARGGGEDLNVLGSHLLDMIQGLAGLPQWCFATVTQKGKPITRQDVVEGNEGLGPLAGDAVQASYGLADGSTAYLASRRAAAGKPTRYGLQILGSAGIIEVLEAPMAPVKFLGDPSWSPGRSNAKWQDVSTAGIGQPEPLKGKEYESRHYRAIQDLLSAIENDREPLAGPTSCRGVMEMIAAVFESQRVGGPVTLPLKTRVNPLTLL